MIGKLKTAIEFGGNLRVFDHFDTISRRHIKESESHLNICKNNITTFAKALANQYPKAGIDYAEFSSEEGKFLTDIRRIQPDLPEGASPEKVDYDSASVFLTFHDYRSNEVEDELRDIKTKFKKTYNLVKKNGHIFVIEYNFKPWIHKLENSRKVFKRWFNVGNEKEALKSELDCFERHTWLSLDMIIEAGKNAGFETRHAEAYALPHPKFCFYVGKK